MLLERLQRLSPLVMPQLLEREAWGERLPASVYAALSDPGTPAPVCSLEVPPAVTAEFLERLLQEPTPTMAATALFLIAALDGPRARLRAADLTASCCC